MRIRLDSFVMVIVFSAIGIIISGIMEVMYNAGYILDEFISGTVTLVDLQIIVVIFSIIIGLVLAATKR